MLSDSGESLGVFPVKELFDEGAPSLDSAAYYVSAANGWVRSESF